VNHNGLPGLGPAMMKGKRMTFGEILSPPPDSSLILRRIASPAGLDCSRLLFERSERFLHWLVRYRPLAYLSANLSSSSRLWRFKPQGQRILGPPVKLEGDNKTSAG